MKFNSLLTSMDIFRQKIHKKTLTLNDTLDHMKLIDIYRTFHPKTAEYTFLSSAYETSSRTGHMLGHKTNHSNFKDIEIPSIFSDHNGMRLEINYKKSKNKGARSTVISLEEFPIERKHQQKTMKNSTHLPERCIDEQGYKGL